MNVEGVALLVTLPRHEMGQMMKQLVVNVENEAKDVLFYG